MEPTLIKKSIQKVSENTLKIENYLSGKNLGDSISYRELELKTGVKMNTYGKSYLRTAIKRLNLDYECIQNEGIVLISDKNAGRIIVHKLVKIDNAVKRGKRSLNVIYDRVYESLSEPEKKHINFIGAAFGAIQLAAENGKRMIKIQNKAQNNKDIPLPE